MNNMKNVQNYWKMEVEPNSILPRAYDIIVVYSFSEHSHIHCSLPPETKETWIVNPPLGTIKLNMSFTATSSYLTLLAYYHTESKSNIQDKFTDNLKSYNGSNLQIWKLFHLNCV